MTGPPATNLTSEFNLNPQIWLISPAKPGVGTVDATADFLLSVAILLPFTWYFRYGIAELDVGVVVIIAVRDCLFLGKAISLGAMAPKITTIHMIIDFPYALLSNIDNLILISH